MELTEKLACKFARIALAHVGQEYPNKLDHVMESDADAKTPRGLHPAFFGSYDWHSCVHSWWTLLTIRRLFPATIEAGQIAVLAEETLSAVNLAAELEYLQRPASRGFERPYGWGWMLFLHHEAARHKDREWAERLGPLARHFAGEFAQYLPKLTYPITVGTHYNTAFALVLAREWALERDQRLVSTIDDWALQAFSQKRSYAGWEPGGDEFLSPVLIASKLMSVVMPKSYFIPWFQGLVIENDWLKSACEPAQVSDRTDGKIAHLDGLNLSRSWCLNAIHGIMGEGPWSPLMSQVAGDHLEAALEHVAGDYMGEHWLASFALLALLSR